MRPVAGVALAIAVGITVRAEPAAAQLHEVARRKRAPSPVLYDAPADAGDTRAGALVLRAASTDRVLLRGGGFVMGSTDREVGRALEACHADAPAAFACLLEGAFEDERAAHDVLVRDVWLDRREVTVARWERCVAAGACSEPPYASGAARLLRPELPVVLVTWGEAAAFCAWDGGRLPTEAEWERAARGLSGRRYPWGDVYNPRLANHGRLAWPELEEQRADGIGTTDGVDGAVELAAAGAYPDGRTPDGVWDLAGNAAEWVADWYAPQYSRESAVDPTGPLQGEERVVRGGGWASARPWMRGAARAHERPGARRPWLGFRCVRDPGA